MKQDLYQHFAKKNNKKITEDIIHGKVVKWILRSVLIK
jgi:hypothetical protein